MSSPGERFGILGELFIYPEDDSTDFYLNSRGGTKKIIWICTFLLLIFLIVPLGITASNYDPKHDKFYENWGKNLYPTGLSISLIVLLLILGTIQSESEFYTGADVTATGFG